MVTAPSRSVLNELRPFGLRPPQVVISNPIDTALFRPACAEERAALRNRFGLSRPTITYGGRLGPEKNIDILLHALATLRDRGVDADLAIAGHGSHEPILRKLAADLRIADHVRLFGTLQQDDLAELLRISDTFAIMSTSETQSMVLLQAMASGVPVIAARCRALPEFVGPENGVLVDSHDRAGLADAMQALLASSDRRRRLGAGARRSAEKYRVETVTDAWEGLYRSMLRRSLAA
jgi:glycosyltransferase involved in cell wall biosynthesis